MVSINMNFFTLNQRNQTNQTNQINKLNKSNNSTYSLGKSNIRKCIDLQFLGSKQCSSCNEKKRK